MAGLARPIFVVGSPRSGTSILTWCLGQHPMILPVEETNWIGKFAAGLKPVYEIGASRGAHSQLSASGISCDDFFEHLGESINELMLRAGTRTGDQGEGAFKLWRSPLDPKTRWVDGTPEYSHAIPLLLKLFPEAKFIHILRDAESVVKSLMNFSNVGAINFTEQAAYEKWLRAVRACVDAEEQLGPERVLRIAYSDIKNAPEALLRTCLDFVGEPYSAHCLEPLQTKINSSNVAPDFDPRDDRTDPRIRDEAERLSNQLLSGNAVPIPRIADAAKAETGAPSTTLEDRPIHAVVQRMQRAVQTTMPPDAVAAVVSKGDDDLLDLRGRQAWHFPQMSDGRYTGYHPADSREAIAHLDDIRIKGANFLVFPLYSLWWLDHYTAFRSHLDTSCQRVWDDESCVVYQL